MTNEKHLLTEKNPNVGLIKELNQIFNNLEYGWDCKKYKVIKTNESNGCRIERLEYDIKITLTPK